MLMNDSSGKRRLTDRYNRYARLAGIIGLAILLTACGQRNATRSAVSAEPSPQPSQPAATVTSTMLPSTQTPTSTIATEPTLTVTTTTEAMAPLPIIPTPEAKQTESEYRWNQLLARDAIRPIYEPEFAPADEAPYSDDELVIGVEINGEAKAYAIGPLNSREMVNDTLGGRPILVTW